jgi:tetratricopeptide (TPR) repeat protein
VIKGIILIRNGEYSEALESLHQEGILFHFGRRDQFLELMARIAPYLVLAHCEVGKISEAKRLANSIGELINSTQNRNLAIELEIALVLVYLGVKDYQAAENLISTIKPKLEGFNIQWWVMNLRLSEARVTLEQGNLQTSWKLIAELINEFESDERYKPGIAFAFYLKGEIFRHLGDFTAARNFFESGITCTNNQFFQFRNAIPLSVVEYLSGEKEISFTILNSVLADIQAKNYQLLEVTARFTYLLFLAERLERETFFSEYLLLQQHIVDLGETLMVADMLYLEGVKAVRFGDLYEGLKKLKEGYEAAKKAGDFWTQLMCLRGYIHDSPLPNSCAEERKIFGQLLEQLKGKYDSVELETKVRKYISTQKKSIKE